MSRRKCSYHVLYQCHSRGPQTAGHTVGRCVIWPMFNVISPVLACFAERGFDPAVYEHRWLGQRPGIILRRLWLGRLARFTVQDLLSSGIIFARTSALSMAVRYSMSDN